MQLKVRMARLVCLLVAGGAVGLPEEDAGAAPGLLALLATWPLSLGR
jgi:hypothetical protein